ncbi:MAG: creatininase family protein [Gemmatimonadetes bacterium]|jgi:creatinine amidohydrolase|nr:creatininase family protein [Gemmatimonadota bacterium]MBT5059116.1 creatininase family protein [Gemmatimonadota bacterium]MBT5146096.1 creatininase family protein [Gemmatimonadota bacterium]MBT5591825.1 creatininase family protein [Gemmatimonadota bacterium]MBT5961500.1 creatininase family protein [Gemmatimonadota bacterium]
MHLKHIHPDQLRHAVQAGYPLLVPAGCIETHGPHMAIGHDTIIVEEICDRIAAAMDVVIAPSFDYGPTGYALGGPEDGTIDPNYDAFGGLAKSILHNFLEMGFQRIVVIIIHQGMGAPLAQAFSKAAAELSFEGMLERGYPRGWWADAKLKDEAAWGRIQVEPMILPAASPPAGGDHAGYNETSFLLATRPELVDQSKLDENAPWYCHENEEKSSWSANVEHGQAMVDAVVAAWVDRLGGKG